MTNGNGDGIINTAEEAGRAFQMLGLSQLLSGQFDGAASEPGSCPTSSCPSTSVGGRLQFLLGPTPLGGGSFRALLSAGGQLSVLQLAELDRRLDDGKPNSGRFRLLSQQSNTCMSGGDWNMSSTETACATALLIQ
jgi:hypothetical protein